MRASAAMSACAQERLEDFGQINNVTGEISVSSFASLRSASLQRLRIRLRLTALLESVAGAKVPT